MAESAHRPEFVGHCTNVAPRYKADWGEHCARIVRARLPKIAKSATPHCGAGNLKAALNLFGPDKRSFLASSTGMGVSSQPFLHWPTASSHNSSCLGGFAPFAISKKRAGRILRARRGLKCSFYPCVEWAGALLGKSAGYWEAKMNCFPHRCHLIPIFHQRRQKEKVDRFHIFKGGSLASIQFSARARRLSAMVEMRFNCFREIPLLSRRARSPKT